MNFTHKRNKSIIFFVSDADMTIKKSYTEKILKNALKNFN